MSCQILPFWSENGELSLDKRKFVKPSIDMLGTGNGNACVELDVDDDSGVGVGVGL